MQTALKTRTINMLVNFTAIIPADVNVDDLAVNMDLSAISLLDGTIHVDGAKIVSYETYDTSVSDDESDADEVSEAVAEAVAAEMGYPLESADISNHIFTHKGKSVAEIKAALKAAKAALKQAGGRGVELAEDIDSLRVALAVRSVK